MKNKMDIIKAFFKNKSENYIKAKLSLKKIKKSFDGFVIGFPDVTGDEIMFIKDKWETLPKEIANGVKIMALGMKGDFKNLITKYQPKSYITPHAHKTEYEFGRVIKGNVTDKLTGKTYYENDEYIFSPNELHYLLSTNGCLVQSTLTKDSNYKLKPLSKKEITKLKIV